MTWALLLIATGIIIGIIVRKHAGLIAGSVIALILLLNSDKILKAIDTAGKVGQFGHSIGLW